MHGTPEEELYATAEAMREAMLRLTGSLSKATGKAGNTTTDGSLPPFAPISTTGQPPTTTPGSSGGEFYEQQQQPEEEDDDLNPLTGTANPAGAEDDTENDDQEEDLSNLDLSTAFAFDRDMSRYPASMTSSVRDHVYEGGLRYHAYRAGRYAFPNDETEQNRDDMKHTMTLMLCRGAYFYAPVEEVLEAGAEVLDLGMFFFFVLFFFLWCWRCLGEGRGDGGWQEEGSLDGVWLKLEQGERRSVVARVRKSLRLGFWIVIFHTQETEADLTTHNRHGDRNLGYGT
jgi:hypothetical protein